MEMVLMDLPVKWILNVFHLYHAHWDQILESVGNIPLQAYWGHISRSLSIFGVVYRLWCGLRNG
jgi:hypothetical protein